MSRALGRATRPKKLTPKQNVHIFREEQVDSINDTDALRTQIETGVDKAEESVSTYLKLDVNIADVGRNFICNK